MQGSPDYCRWQYLGAGVRSQGCAGSEYQTNAGREAKLAIRPKKQPRKLAIVSWATGFGHRRETESTRSLGPEDEGKHSLADTYSRVGPFQSGRLGEPDICHQCR